MSFLDDIIDEKKAFQWIEQGTPEWDNIRVGRFTASEIWKLTVEPKTNADKEAGKLSETALTYVSEKVAEVMTGQAKQQGYAFPLVWGTEKEPEAIEEFVNRTGYKHERVGFFPFTDHAGGSPDGFINDDAILEVKCPYDSATQLDYLMLTDQWDLKRLKREYYWQCQANMLFTDRTLCHFVTFDPRMKDEKHRMTHMLIKAIPEDQDLLVKKIGIAVKEKLELLKLLS
jgi:exodeoxyribonuclease (lambda-induced)